MEGVLLNIQSVMDGVLSVILKGCGFVLVGIFALIFAITFVPEVKACIKHEQPNVVDGIEPMSAKKVFILDGFMVTAAAVLLFILLN